MALRVLPGDKEIFHRRYTDKFNSWYGEGIDAKQIYMNCGNNFVKFHAVFPDQAWLVERICRIYKHIDVSLDAFKAKLVEEDKELELDVVLSTKYKDNDPFTYFQDNDLDILHRKLYGILVSTLKTYNKGWTGSTFRELARSLLQSACEPQRKELVDELTSQETFDTLSTIHVGASTNIYTVRSVIMLQEDMSALNLARIREALAQSEDIGRSTSDVDEATPESSSAESAAPLPPVISSAEAGGSGLGSYTVARTGQGLQWTVRRS